MDESITVERVGHALIVGRLDENAVQLAERLPGGPDRTFVVVGDSSLDAMTRLDPWVIADLADEVTGDLCVVAPGFGSMGQDGTLPPARLLADRLGVEVTAADGTPLGLADGTVFVPGGWFSYQPGGQRTPVGARLPAPWWQDGLPEPTDHVTHIPAGLWIRGTEEPRPDDPLLHRVPDRDRMYVVLGAPGEPPPAVATVAEALRALPERHPAVLAWYGEPAGELLRAVADALGAPVRAAHGVPGDGRLVYADGWHPFAAERVYEPGGGSLLYRWIAPLPMVSPGAYRLCDGWLVDVVARGLIVRPESARPEPRWAAALGSTADVVVVGHPPAEAFDGLMRDLPKGLRIVPAAAAPVGALAVTADGRILPVRPILASAPAATVDIRDGVLTIDLAENDLPTPGIPTVAAASVAPAVTPAARPVLTWEPAPDTPTPGPDPVAAPFVAPAPSPAPAAAVAVAAATPTQVVAAAPAFVPAAPVAPTELESASLGSMVAASSAPAVRANTEESSVADLLPVHTTQRPSPIEVPEDARSTAAQRRAMRGRLGSSYDVATRAVTRLLSERPGLRFGAGDRSALLTELAVVRVFADNPGGQYDADFYVCLADGLRRLPTARAVVVRGIPADTDVRPASVIRLPTPMVAAPAKSTAPVGPAEALIWTTTARRLDGLVDDESRTDDVVLSGHTTLRVLAVENQRVLLAEDGTAGDVALTRLRAAAAARVATPAPASRWFGPLPAA